MTTVKQPLVPAPSGPALLLLHPDQASARAASHRRNQQRRADVSHWLKPDECAAQITVWPLSHGADEHHQLKNRVSLCLDIGAATVHLRPTAAETRALIDALQWALAQSEATAEVPA